MKRNHTLAAIALAISFCMLLPQSTKESVMAETRTPAESPAVEAETEVTFDVEAERAAVEPNLPPEAIAEEEDLYREGLAAYITSVNGTVSEGEALDMVDCILEQAAQYEMDEKLLMAIAHTESTYYSGAVSCANYKGLMQTGDALAEEAGYSPDALFDPAVSIAIGAGYIREQLDAFDQNVTLALAAYNQGPGAVYAGTYSTNYADLTLQRVENIETFLLEQGYL